MKRTTNLSVLLLLFLCAVYSYFLWIRMQPYFVPSWSYKFMLDSSYLYAFLVMPDLGYFVGRDTFFNYGPLVHYLFVTNPWFSLSYIPILLVAICFIILVYTKRKFDISFLFLILSLVFYGLIANQHATFISYLTLIIALFGYYLLPNLMAWRVLLAILGILAFQFKFNIAIGVSAAYFISIIFSPARAIRKLLYLVTFLVAVIATFYVLSKGGDVFSYVYYSYEITSSFSETFSFGSPSNRADYLTGIGLCATLILIYWLGTKNSKCSYRDRIAMFLIVIGFLFMGFKYAYIRPDSHTVSMIYLSGMLGIISTVFLINKNTRNNEILLSSILILTVGYYFDYSFKNCPSLFTWNKLFSPKTVDQQNREAIMIKNKNEDQLKKRFPMLVEALRESCLMFKNERGVNPKVVFYPYEQMLVLPVKQYCDLMITPGFQIDNFGPHKKLSQLEAQFLKVRGPDFIVISNNTIDDRNSLTDYGDILEVLLTYYKPTKDIGDFIILRRIASIDITNLGHISCNDNFETYWNFIRVEYQPDNLEWLAYRILKFVFRPPKYTLKTSILPGDHRVYLTQIRKGIYLAPQGILGVLRGSSGKLSLAINPNDVHIQNSNWWTNWVRGSNTKVDTSYCRFEKK